MNSKKQNKIDIKKSQNKFSWGIFVERLIPENNNDKNTTKITVNFIFLENLPSFNENNSDQQQRFITFIDIVYEKKIPLMITSETDIGLIESSKNLSGPFKRTTSR